MPFFFKVLWFTDVVWQQVAKHTPDTKKKNDMKPGCNEHDVTCVRYYKNLF